LCEHVFNSLKKIPRNKITGSYGETYAELFEEVSNCPTAEYTFSKQYMRVSISLCKIRNYYLFLL
jgi:hypothetical protein